MKKIKTPLMALSLTVAMLFQTGCFGSFNLTRKVYEFNNEVGDRFINNIVFWAFLIIPVYEVTTFLDAFILNVLEFWTGSNPVAMNDGETDTRMVRSGDKIYEITASRNQFHIVQTAGAGAGEQADILFNPEGKSCSLRYNGKTIPLAAYDQGEQDRIDLFLPGGKTLTVDASSRDAGVLQGNLPAVKGYMARK